MDYVVKKNDTLSEIARAYGVESVGNILLANGLDDATKIRIGQKLFLPNPTKNLTPEKPKNTPKPAPKKTPSKSTEKASPSSITYGSYTLELKP